MYGYYRYNTKTAPFGAAKATEKVPLLRCRSPGQSSRMSEYAAVARIPAPCRMNFFNILSS